MAGIADLRKFSWAQGKTDLEIASTVAEKSGTPLGVVAFDLGVALPNEAGFRTSLKNSLYSTAQGIGQLAGDVGLGNNNALEVYGRAGVQRNPVTIMDGDGSMLENFGSNLVNDPLGTVSQIGGQIAGLAIPVGGLKAGVGLYRGARGLGELGRVGKGAMAGAEMTAYGLPSYGSMRDSQESLGQNSALDLIKAGGSALAIGGVERFAGLEAMLAGKNIAGATLKGTIGRQALGEAGEEAIQAPIEQFGSGKEVFSRETLDQMLAGAAVGGIGGGLMGPIGYYAGRQPAQNQSIDLVNEEQDLAEPLALPNYNPAGSTLYTFPDGSSGTQEQVDAYLRTLPEVEQVAARAALYGFKSQPTTETMLGLQETPPLLENKGNSAVNPAGPKVFTFPDGSSGTQEQAEAFISSLPPEQQVAARAQMFGYGSQKARRDPNAVTDVTPQLQNPLFATADGLVQNRPLTDTEIFAKDQLTQRQQATQQETAAQDKAVELYNNVTGSNNKSLPAKKQPIVAELADMLEQGLITPEDTFNIIENVRRSRFEVATKKLNELKASISANPVAAAITPTQQAVFEARLNEDNAGKSDAQLAQEAGISRQAFSQTKKRAKQELVKNVAKQQGIAAQEAEQMIAERLEATKPRAQAQEDIRGLSPAMQEIVVDERDTFTGEDGSANLSIVDSPQDGQISIGEKVDVPDTPDPIYEARVAAAKAKREAEDAEVLQHPYVAIALEDWEDMKSTGAPAAWELPRRLSVDWVRVYIAYKNGEITDDQLQSEQRDIEDDFDREFRAPSGSQQRVDSTERTGSTPIAETKQNVVGSDSQAEELTRIIASQNTDAEADIETATTARTLPQIMAELKSRSANPIARDFSGRIKQGEDVEAEVNAWLDAVSSDEKTQALKSEDEGLYDYRGDKNKRVTYEYAKRQSENAFYKEGLGSLFLELTGVSLKEMPSRGEITFNEDEGTFNVAVSPSLIDRNDPVEIAHTLRHEFAHGMDYVLGWALSENEMFEFKVNNDGSVEPVGSVAKELYNFYEQDQLAGGAEQVKLLLSYPLNRNKWGDFDNLITQAELFAQLESQWLTPTGKSMITRYLPKTAKYLEAANEYAKTQLQALNADGKTPSGNKRSFPGKYSSAEVQRGTDEVQTSNSGGGEGLASYAEEVSPRGKEFVSAVNNARKKLAPRVLTGTQITEQYGDEITTLREHQNILNKMSAEQSRLRKAGTKLVETWATWASKNKSINARLEQLMGEATRLGIHPDLPFDAKQNAHLDTSKLADYNRLSAQYKAMPADAKQIYQDARATLTENWETRKQIYADVVMMAYEPRIAAAVKAGDTKTADTLTRRRDKEVEEHANQVTNIKGPYFPQMRFGDYILVAESKELSGLREQLADAKGDDYKKLSEKLAKMEAQEKHYIVEAFESRLDADRKAPQLERRGFTVRKKLAEEYAREFRPVSADAVERIGSALDASFDAKTSEKLKTILTEMHINSLPEQHALTRQLKRVGVAGASEQMLRAFAETVERDSHYLSRLKYTKDMTSNLFQMRKEVRGKSFDLQDVYNVMVERTAADHQYQRSPLINALARVSSWFHLGVSPAYLLTNMTQPWMVTAPQLAGRFGGAKAFGAMRTAWVDAVKIVKQGKGGTLLNLADVDLDKITDKGERQIVERLRDLGKLDADMLLDMANLSEGISPAMFKATKAFGWATHHTELVNRISTALATYRLEKQKDPLMSEDKLVERAIDMVDKTQLDYSNENAALFMKTTTGVGPIKKLIYQFRKYQQGMLYLLGSNAKLAFQGDKEARKALGYLLGMNVAMAGAVGMPLTAPVLGALNAFFDDDDEEGDAETQMRNYLAELLGEDAARVAWKGLPNAFGLDLSSNVGWGGLLKPLPMMAGRDVTDARTGEDLIKELFFNAMGASAGMTANMVDGVMLAAEGDMYKGLARMSPRSIASVIKAAELGDVGLTTRSGATALEAEAFDAWDLAFRAAGFNPTKASEYYAAMSAKEDVSQEIQGRRKSVLKDYALAKMRGEDLTDALESIQAFNEAHPTQRINRSAMLRAVQTRTSAGDEVDEVGVRFRRNEESLRNIDAFAK